MRPALRETLEPVLEAARDQGLVTPNVEVGVPTETPR
jgi:hypothetical protein